MARDKASANRLSYVFCFGCGRWPMGSIFDPSGETGAEPPKEYMIHPGVRGRQPPIVDLIHPGVRGLLWQTGLEAGFAAAFLPRAAKGGGAFPLGTGRKARLCDAESLFDPPGGTGAEPPKEYMIHPGVRGR